MLLLLPLILSSVVVVVVAVVNLMIIRWVLCLPLHLALLLSPPSPSPTSFYGRRRLHLLLCEEACSYRCETVGHMPEIGKVRVVVARNRCHRRKGVESVFCHSVIAVVIRLQDVRLPPDHSVFLCGQPSSRSHTETSWISLNTKPKCKDTKYYNTA